MKKYLLILVCLAGCGLPKNAKEITKAEYGDRWPFTVEKGILRCEDGMVVFESDGNEYGVNGLAQNQFKKDIGTILQDDDQYGQINGHSVKKSVEPIIKDGRNLCE
jgi:hypothetical protein